VDFEVGESQQAVQQLAREVLGDLVTPERLTALERTGTSGVWDVDAWQALVRAGVVGACLPEEYGGGGLGLVELALVLEEVGRTVAPVPAVATIALGALAIVRHGTAEQRATLLPQVVEGRLLLAAALAEPGETDPRAPVTTAVRDGEGWLLTGEKAFVPYGAQADRVLVPAATGPGEVGVFLLDPTTAGVTVTALLTTSREPTAHLDLDGVRVTDDALLGGVADDRGPDLVNDIVLVGTTALACVQAGICDAALRMTADYTRERQQFGQPIGSFQAVGQRAADAYVDTELVRLTALQAAWRLGEGWPADDEVAVAKFWAADGGSRVVHACQHLHGGIGVDVDYPLHRYFLHTKQIEHTLGSPTRQLLRLGAALANQPV
jgi:alkylation response protein AidB-like acyl-CoA dehydrogenase